ncbi:MAG: hypothetical protein QOK30_1476 [Nocardioidaceae bacterium]|jgi:hypothetical protein|nr:hypothetical protein [Nocardioidaceae bacterium]
MWKWKMVAAASLVVASLAVTVPAQAQHINVRDAAGDTIDRGPDMTSVSFRNRDHAVVVVFTFVHDRRGEVIFPVRARGLGFIGGVVSQHPHQGPDHVIFETRAGRTPCPRLTSDWNRRIARVKIRVPSGCLNGGDYGAIKSWALIEGYHSTSSDVDYAPETPNGHLTFTDWIPRG